MDERARELLKASSPYSLVEGETVRLVGEDADGRPKRILFRCPKGNTCWVPLAPMKLPNGHTWHWDGDREAPTITPSINCVGCWHGWIRGGKTVDS